MVREHVPERVRVRARPRAPGHHAPDLGAVRAHGLVFGHRGNVHQFGTPVAPVRARHLGDGHELVQFPGGGRRRRLGYFYSGPAAETGRPRTDRAGGRGPAHRALLGRREHRIQHNHGVHALVAGGVSVFTARRYGTRQLHAHRAPERGAYAVRKPLYLVVRPTHRDRGVAVLGDDGGRDGRSFHRVVRPAVPGARMRHRQRSAPVPAYRI